MHTPLHIAGLSLYLDSDHPLHIESKFNAFLQESKPPDYTIRFREVDVLPGIPGAIVHEEINYRVHPGANGRYIRSFSDPPRDDTPYAVAAYDYDNGIVQVDYLAKGASCVAEMGNSFGHLNFEELLLRRGRLCLHASCVDTPLGGILFSGPSGIGKSTQSSLWCKFRGARLINDDRPILSKSDERWLAWGSPYAGSSKCHVNANCAVRAIVILRKGEEGAIRQLSVTEAFRKVWAGLTIHSWDASYVAAALDLAQELVQTVPVYELTRTRDEQSVIRLEEALRKECDG